jgi:hypothetical protein
MGDGQLFPLRNDRSLNLTVPVMSQICEYLRQMAKRLFVVHKVLCRNAPICYEAERAGHMFWCVMESRLAVDLGIMQKGSVERHLGSCRAASKEVDGPAFADQMGCEFPGVRISGCFNDDIGAAPIRPSLSLMDGRSWITQQNAFISAQHHGAIYLFEPSRHHKHASAISELRKPNEY